MTVPWTAIAMTLLLAAAFAAVGETALWRFSENVFSWNESFLVGAGTCAAILFPLSILLGHGALRFLVGFLGVAVAITILRRMRRPRRPAARSPSPKSVAKRDAVGFVLLAAIGVVAAVFLTLNFRYAYLWDGFQIWASKAQVLSHQGRLGADWYPGVSTKPLSLNYPALIPLYESLLCLLRGGFDFDVLKPVFLVFYVSLLLSTFRAARAILPQRLALAATLLLALLPAVSTGVSAGGYADMPQAAFVAAVMAACLDSRPEQRGWRHPASWLLGSLTTVKSEGLILAAIACLAIALPGFLEGPRRFAARFRTLWSGALVVVVFGLLRVGYLRWLNVPDLVYGPVDAPHLVRALTLLGADAKLCLQALVDRHEWALLWPAFFVGLAILLKRGSPAEKSLALSTLAALGAYAGIFLFSNWPLAMHVPNAYPRLLVHLAPAAVVTVVLGYARALARRPAPERAGSRGVAHA